MKTYFCLPRLVKKCAIKLRHSISHIEHPQQPVFVFIFFVRNCARCGGKGRAHDESQRPAIRINKSRNRNLQVASAGEDEEDLRVVDRQLRTARRADEHGCASNRFRFSLKGSKDAEALTSTVSSWNIRSRERDANFRQLVVPPLLRARLSVYRTCAAASPARVSAWGEGERKRGWV